MKDTKNWRKIKNNFLVNVKWVRFDCDWNSEPRLAKKVKKPSIDGIRKSYGFKPSRYLKKSKFASKNNSNFFNWFLLKRLRRKIGRFILFSSFWAKQLINRCRSVKTTIFLKNFSHCSFVNEKEQSEKKQLPEKKVFGGGLALEMVMVFGPSNRT